jgi:hypothetical protein
MSHRAKNVKMGREEDMSLLKNILGGNGGGRRADWLKDKERGAARRRARGGEWRAASAECLAEKRTEKV